MLCEVRGWIFRRQERRKPGGLCPDPVGQPFSLLYINEKTGYAFWPAVCRRACAYAFDIEITFKRFGRARRRRCAQEVPPERVAAFQPIQARSFSAK